MGVVGAITAAVAAIGGGIYAEDQGSDAHDRSREAGLKQEEANAKLLNQQKDLIANESKTADSTRIRDQALARQRALAQQSQGRNSTILTSPLGVTQQGPTSGAKTILGS